MTDAWLQRIAEPTILHAPLSESVVSDCLIAHKKGAPLDATQYFGYLVLDIADSPGA
jgi:hypothetical protein